MKVSLCILSKAFIAFSLFLILSNSAFSQTNVSGVISTNTTWTKAASPYNVTGNILVNSGVILTINDGVTIKVNGDFYIKIEGNLNAVGTTNSKIIFESNSLNLSKRNWQGIQIRPTGGSALNSDQSYLSGTRLKNVVIKNAVKGVYVYGAGIHISNVEFNQNDFGVEIRSSLNVVLDNNRFINNNYGIYTEYEAYGGDGTSNIENTYILNNIFSSNTNGAYFFLNQRQFKNLNVISNLFENNTIGITFSGGGYGCSVQSATISQNTFLSNQTYGLKVGQIMSQASDARTPYAFIVEKNSFVDNGVFWEYGGGAGGATSSFSNNVISTKNVTSLVIKGESSRSDLFSKNYIYSNVNAISVQPLFANSYFPSNKTISYNSIRGNSINSLVKILGSNMLFNYNNFRPYNPQILFQVDGVNDINSNYNYWGTSDLSKINEGIFDKSDNFELGQANIVNILSNLEPSAPIFPVNNLAKTLNNGRVVLSWTANQESDIAGYKVYYGGFTGYSYTNSVDAGNVLTYTLPAGVGIDEDIAVTAYDASKDGTDDQFDGNESWYSPANKAPIKPVISSITPSERKIDIAWGAIANTDKYNVYKSLDGVTYTLQASVKTTSYSHTNLNTLQQRYYYKVAAFDSLDLSYTSYGLEGSSSDVSDSKPTNKGTISSVETVNKAVKLNLTYNSLITNITNYKIYRSSAGEARQLIKTLPISTLFHVDSVQTDKQYTYDITISNSTEESDASSTISAVSFSVPLLIKSFNDKLNLATTDSLRWATNALATKYQIQLDTVNTYNSSVLVSSISSNDFFRATNLIKDKYVFWRVRSGDSNGYSDWTANQRIQIASKKPSIDSVYSYTGRIKLKLNTGSYLGIDSIYVYRKTANVARSLIFRAPKSQVYFQDDVSNGIYYTYDILVKSPSDQSEKSVEKKAAAFSAPAMSFPNDNQFNVQNNTTFKWASSTLADKYIIELDTSSLFNSPQLVRTTSSDTLFAKTEFLQNEYYYWRVKAGDINGYSNWSNIRKLQTFVAKPVFSEVKPANKKSLLKFNISSWKNISKIYILRDTIASPLKIIDSSNVSISQYLDTLNLKLNQKYYYSLRLVNKQGISSDFASSVLSIPFNLKPEVKVLTDKIFNNVGEYNFVRSVYSSSGSKDLDGKITTYKWFVNDSLVNATDSILVYYFRHGTHNVKLVIADNDGDKDSSSAVVSLNSFVKTFKAGFLGGITALNSNVIYTADSNYDPISGASVSILDRLGNSIYPLVVSSKIFTTPSVATDSSVFITSGSSLNGFNKSGAPLWSTIPLGGLSYVTPTIDSLFNRIYVGVSNKNFLAIDYKTGKVAWNIIGDAAINSSAVITGDRKLIFTSQSGTLYGFDIKSNESQTTAKWKLNLGEVVSNSPAVDRSNNLYIGTEAGNLLKIRLNTDGTIEQLWKTNLVSSLQISPVIDADGNVYIGNRDGAFYKINSASGAIIWKFETGSGIKSTPSISEFGNIYVANMSGLIFALNSNKVVKWRYQADGPISANILYINNMLYLGTESGKLIALYDNPATNTLNTGLSTNSIITSKGKQILGDNLATSNRVMNQTLASSALKEPIWGTFQGNYRRTGSKSFECPSTPKLFVPSCTDFAETIKVSTDNMANRYWVINDQIQKELLDSAITVKLTDKVKIMAYNSVGCNVYSETPIKLLSSVISKPQIVTNTGTTKFCEGSTIILNSKDSYKNYQWNFSTYAISGSTDKTLSTSLPGAYSITAINEFGCKATSDIVLIMTTPTPVAPTITIENKETLVSNYSGITWYKDGVALPDTARKINLKSDGLYTARITKNGCVSPISNSVRYSSVIVLGVNKEVQFTLSPNPFISYLKIEFPEKFGLKVDVELYNLLGNLIWKSKDLPNGEKINLETINQGIYLLKLINASGETLESKVIKL
jgi:outer membrane protein assembly factor BamB